MTEINGLVLKRVKGKGKGVFAARAFKKGEKILGFAGDLFTWDQLPESEIDGTKPSHYMQIGKKLYQGPTKTIESFVNHSCEPNCGVKIKGAHAILMAIRKIDIGEEITWDYSTTMMNDPWVMPCECGSLLCRKKVGNFDMVQKETQKKYIRLGIVPKYIVNSLKKKK